MRGLPLLSLYRRTAAEAAGIPQRRQQEIRQQKQQELRQHEQDSRHQRQQRRFQQQRRQQRQRGSVVFSLVRAMATTSVFKACSAVVAGAAAAAETTATCSTAAAGAEAASSDAGAREAEEDSIAAAAGQAAAWYSVFVRSAAKRRGGTGPESRERQKQLWGVLQSEEGVYDLVVAAGTPAAAADTAAEEAEGETGAAEGAAVACGRVHVCSTPTPAAIAGAAGGGYATDVLFKAAAVSGGENAAAETAAGRTVACVEYSELGGLHDGAGEARGTRTDTAADAAADAAPTTKAKVAAAGDVAGKTRGTLQGTRAAGAGAGATAEWDVSTEVRRLGSAVAATAAREGDEKQMRCVCMFVRRVERMGSQEAAAPADNIRGRRASSYKRSRSCTVSADRTAEATGEGSCSTFRPCGCCCCWCCGAGKGRQEAALVQHACGLLRPRRHDGPQQQQQQRCSRKQQRVGTRQGCQSPSSGSDGLFDSMHPHATCLRCPYWTAGWLQRWKAAVYAAALLLAFTCGKMYGSYMAAPEYCNSWPCAFPFTCSPPLAAREREEARALSEDRMAPPVKDATAAAQAPQRADAAEGARHGHPGEAPTGTVKATAAGEAFAAATNGRGVAATDEEGAAAALEPRADETAFFRGFDEAGGATRSMEGKGSAAAKRAVWTTPRRGSASTFSRTGASLSTIAPDCSGGGQEECGRSSAAESRSDSSGRRRRGNSNESRSNTSDSTSRHAVARELSAGSKASDGDRGNSLNSNGSADLSCSSSAADSCLCSMSEESSSGSNTDGFRGSWSRPASSNINPAANDDARWWSASSSSHSWKEDVAINSSSDDGGSLGMWAAAVRQGIASGRIRFADFSALLGSASDWSAAAAASEHLQAVEEEDAEEEFVAGEATFGRSGVGAPGEDFFDSAQEGGSEANDVSAFYENLGLLPSVWHPKQPHFYQKKQQHPQHHHRLQYQQQHQQQPVPLHQEVPQRQQQHSIQQQQPPAMLQQQQQQERPVHQEEERGKSELQLRRYDPSAGLRDAGHSADIGSGTQEEFVQRFSFETANSATSALSAAAVGAAVPSASPDFPPPSSPLSGVADDTSFAGAARRAVAPLSAVAALAFSSSLVPAPAADAPAAIPSSSSFSSAAEAAAAAPASSLLLVRAATGASAAAAGAAVGVPASAGMVQARRLTEMPYPNPPQKSEKTNGESPRVRSEHPQSGATPREDLSKKRLEAKIKKRLAATASGAAPPAAAAASQEKKKDNSSAKRSSTEKPRQGSSRQEGAAPGAAQSPRLLDPHIFRKELCPFLRTGDTQLKSWFALLVLYIAEWPAYAYTGNGGKRFIDQLRYYAENFRPPLRASDHGKKLFDDELACGTTEVFKEGLAALKDRIHNFADMTRVLKHLAKTERDFADLLDYTQYSKLPARAAVTGFALLLRTAFEGMVFSFCKSVFLRKGFKGNFNRKELYSNVVWLYHRTQTQYWMLLLVGKIIKQIASGRPHTGIVILRSEESPRFRAVGDSSSFSSPSTAYGGGTKGQMLEVLYGVGAYSALQRIVSGTIRKKVGWALSRFDELASEKGERSPAKGVLQPHVFVTGYYGKTSRGTEVREGLFGSEVEAEALEEMMEDLPAGHVLLQISLVDEWIFRDPAEWTRLHRSEADVLTAYTAVQMLRAELSWDPSLGSLGAFSVAYTGVTDLYSRQRTTAEERRYDPDVHVLLMDDATRFVQTASEEGCRSRILSIVSEDPLQLRRSVPASRISIRGTAKLLPSGELFRKGSFGMGLSLELQRSAEKRLRMGHIMIHVYVRGLNRRSPDTDDLDFTASELVSRLLQRSEGYYDIPVVKMVTPITSQSLIPRGVVTSCAHTVPDWVVVVSSCSIAVFFLAMIILLMYHEKLKLPWWLHCFCSSSSPWSVEEEVPSRDSPVEIPGEYGKSRRRASSKSSKQSQAYPPMDSDISAADAAEVTAALALAGEEEAADAGSPRGDEPGGTEEEDAAALEPSSLASRAGSGEAEEARGWLPAAAKWVGDRSLSTLSQRSKNHIVMGGAGGKMHTQQRQSIVGSDAEEDEEAGILQANRRSSSQQLAALGSASTCASTCAHAGLHHGTSIESSEWRVPISSPGSSVLRHQQQSALSRSDSERDPDRTRASFDDKENGLNNSRAGSFCVRAAYSPFRYVSSSTLSCSEPLATARCSQQHIGSNYAPVQVCQQKESHAVVATSPAKDFSEHVIAFNGDAPCVKTALSGSQHAQGTGNETSSLPGSQGEKQASVDACAAGPVTRRSFLDNCSVRAPHQLLLAGSGYTPSSESSDAASSVFLKRSGSASPAVKYSRGIPTGAPRFLLPEESSHGSMSDDTLHELEEFD